MLLAPRLGNRKHLDVDETTEVVYGVDRAVEVLTTQGKSNRAKLAAVAVDSDGNMRLRRQITRIKVFAIQNRDTQHRELILYCAAADQGQSEALSPQPERVSDQMARYSLPLAPRTEQNFEVIYTQMNQERVKITGKNAGEILRLLKPDVQVDEAVETALRELVAFQVAKTAAQSRLDELRKQKVAMELEQTRVRNNVKVLSNNQEAARLFLEKIQTSETQIETVNQQMESVQVELNRIEAQQTKAIRNKFGRNR